MTGPGVAPVLAVVLVAVLAVAGCGIDPDDEPETLAIDVGSDSLPVRPDDDPLADAFPQSTQEEEFTATVFLSDGDQLVPVSRTLVAGPDPADRLEAVVGAVVDGPTAAERALGLGSNVPTTTDVLAVQFRGGDVVVDLSSSFTSIGGTGERFAVGQVVLSTATFPGVRSVRIRLDGEPTSVPLPDGSLSAGRLGLADFSALLAEPTVE